MGRPRLSATAKDVLIGARFGKEEAEQVNDAVRRSGTRKSDWLRRVVLSAAKPTAS